MNNTTTVARPQPGDYAPYFFKYIDLVNESDIMKVLESQLEEMEDFYKKVKDWDYSYAPGKWTVKECLIHLIDTERVFYYRAMCIARGEKGSLPSFDQDEYMSNDFSHVSPAAVLDDFIAQRKSSIALFRNFDHTMWNRATEVSGNQTKALSFPYMIAGHQHHHMTLYKERYKI